MICRFTAAPRPDLEARAKRRTINVVAAARHLAGFCSAFTRIFKV
ncbi:MAG: hypothetical protein ACLP8S_11390 [Solirubrobacteraceae bacterium]